MIVKNKEWEFAMQMASLEDQRLTDALDHWPILKEMADLVRLELEPFLSTPKKKENPYDDSP